MSSFTRREFVTASLAASTGISSGLSLAAPEGSLNVHEQILQLAARQERQRRARFAKIQSKTELEVLQRELRDLSSSDRRAPPAHRDTPRLESPGRSTVATTWSRSWFSRVFPATSFRLCSTGPRKSMSPAPPSSVLVATPRWARPNPRTRSFTSTWPNAVTWC